MIRIGGTVTGSVRNAYRAAANGFLALLFLSAIAAAATSSPLRAATQADWRALLNESGCLFSDAELDADRILPLAVVWQETTLEGLGRSAKLLGLHEYARQGKSLASLESEQLAAVYLQTAPALARLREDFRKYGTDICPIVDTLVESRLRTLARKGRPADLEYQPQFSLVNEIFNLHGCNIGAPNGKFSPRARHWWNRLAPFLSLRTLPDPDADNAGTIAPSRPAIADMIALLRAPVTRRICGGSMKLPTGESITHVAFAHLLRDTPQCSKTKLFEEAEKFLKYGQARDLRLWSKEMPILLAQKAWKESCWSPDEGLSKEEKAARDDARSRAIEAAERKLITAAMRSLGPIGPFMLLRRSDDALDYALAFISEADGFDKTFVGSGIVLLKDLSARGEEPIADAYLAWLGNERDYAVHMQTADAVSRRIRLRVPPPVPAPSPRRTHLNTESGVHYAFSVGKIGAPEALRRTLDLIAANPSDPSGAGMGGSDPAWMPETDGNGNERGRRYVVGYTAGVALDVTVPIGSERRYAALAGYVAADSAALEDLARVRNDGLLVATATFLLEGHSPAGKQVAPAVRLFEAAAALGSGLASLRLAQLIEQGQVRGKPAEAAIPHYEEAFDRGQPLAAIRLARWYDFATEGDADPVRARHWYEKALNAKNPLVNTDDTDRPQALPPGIGEALQAAVADGSPLLTSLEGDALLANATKRTPQLAVRLAEAFSCETCSGGIDLRVATRWYRRAVSAGAEGAAYALARLLTERPDLARSENEAILTLLTSTQREEGNPLDIEAEAMLAYLDARRLNQSSVAISALIDEKFKTTCSGQVTEACVRFAHLLAIGGVDANLAGVGLRHLEDLVGRSLDQRQTSKDVANFAMSMVDVLAFYGDFEGALSWFERGLRTGDLRLGENSAASDYGDGTATARKTPSRNTTFRRIMTGVAEVDTRVGEPLERLLRALAENGDESAELFLLILDAKSPPANLAEVLSARPLDELERNYATQTRRGTMSRGVTNIAHALSLAHHRAGNSDNAARYALIAFNTAYQLERVSGIWDGPIPSALARVCVSAKYSRHLFKIERPAVALVLAKSAVNELQDVRRSLRQLPTHLQVCFRDMVANHYRWLADLFVRQGRPVEAEFVLGLLKDFETFEFLDRDEKFAGETFDRLPLEPNEKAIRAAIESLTPSTGDVQRRLAALERKRATTRLTGPEERERIELRAAIAAETTRIDKVIETVVADARTLVADGPNRPVETIRSIQPTLRNQFDGRAIAVHFVVLPDRMHAVITTPKWRSTHTWTELEGAPFSETALNALIKDYRALIRDPRKDPRPVGRRLYDILIRPIESAMRYPGAETLLLSLDRQLRYLPFAALYDGRAFLAERRIVVGLTEARDQRYPASPVRDVSAFAATKKFGNLSALPTVAMEVDGLVRDNDPFGLFEGRAYFDEAFTRSQLSRTLAPGRHSTRPRSIVHLASHFVIGRSEETSFLLLGDGGQLTISELKNGLASRFDFRNVDLLTLSACDTAFAQVGADGRELESFAATAQGQGADSVLATLWPISDHATTIFMLRYYELAAGNGYDYAQALAEAQREFLRLEIGTGAKPAGTASREANNESIARIVGERVGIDLSALSVAQAGYPLPGFTHPYYWSPFVLMRGMR